MKNNLIKSTLVLLLCLIIFVGCSVVPTPDTIPTPEVTPTPEATPITTPTTPEPTPAPWLATFKKYKTKMGITGDFPSSFYYLTTGQNVAISFSLYGNTFDQEAYEKETEGLYWGTDREKLNKIHSKYVKLAIIDFLKKYNLEDQISDRHSLSNINRIYTTLEVAVEILSDHEVVDFGMTPLDKNGNGIPSLLYKENSRFPISYPYEYDEDWNLIYPNGPVYDHFGDMAYDENGKRVVSE